MGTDIYNSEERQRRRREKRRRENIKSAVKLALIFLLVGTLFWGVAKLSKGSTNAGPVSAEGPKPGWFQKKEPTEPPTEPPTENPDKTPPVIEGVADITAYQGDAVSYRKGVTATDDEDLAPVLSVDTSGVDLSVPGAYTVIYTAQDAAGNVAEVSATITVLYKEETFASLEEIDAAVDAAMLTILEDGMTTQEQVEAIYRWARNTVNYSGHSDRTDYRQTGYRILEKPYGDCYGYFAVTKLMFERLGIPNIDVVKVKNDEEDSNHFWSLVSVDGGENYYHFDATPRVGSGDNFCLVTDEFLDAYSDKHGRCHNRDKSLYPATPELSLDEIQAAEAEALSEEIAE